jgi:DNA replication protein DnaC
MDLMERIDKPLKKTAENIRKGSMATSENFDSADIDHTWGNPDCPICNGIGFIRKDVPVDDPEFGKLQVCACRKTSIARANHERLFKLSNLEAFRDKTFDTFNPHGRVGIGEKQVESIQWAFNHSNQFARTQKGWLLLMGDYGTGKTHLAAAVANFAVEMGVSTLFLTVPDLLDWLRFSYSSTEETFEKRFEEIRNIELLVLDDMGTQNATPWAEEKLYQIINYRYVNKLPLVVTTNLQLVEIEGRIRSRLEDNDLVNKININAPDYRASTDELGSRTQLSSLGLHSERTFGNFNLREREKLPVEEKQSLEKAFRAAQQFAEDPMGWLILMGNFGTGKTHLAAAIGNYRAAMGEAPMLVTVPDLLDHLRATFSPTSTISYDKMFSQIRDSDLLILVNLSTQSATPWAKEKLYQIFNYRYYGRLPTVITTAESLDELDPRIQSRMLDERLCKVNKILVPPYHILPVKTEFKRRKK